MNLQLSVFGYCPKIAEQLDCRYLLLAAFDSQKNFLGGLGK